MKLCSHVITNDTGLAPNPFHGWCTSGLCTPSHQKAKLNKGDWLIGHSRKAEGHQLVYAMCIDEVLCMDNYFRDARFQAKKPRIDGPPVAQCGDNFYYREEGRWLRLPSRFHNTYENFKKDIGHNLAGCPIFVASNFYYFGKKRVDIPNEFAGVIRRAQGIRYTDGDLAKNFVNWLEKNHNPGITGQPRDMVDRSRETGPTIVEYQPDCVTAGEGQASRRQSLNAYRRTEGCR